MKKVLFLLLLMSFVLCQTIMIPSSVGTAGTIATIARGDEVIGYNPANLGFRDNPDFSMSFGVIPILPIPSLNLVNNAVSMDWFADYLFSGEYLDNAKKDKMLDAFGDDGWELNPVAYAKIIGISSGDFAFSIGAEINSDVTLPTSILRLAFFGNQFEEEISLDQVDGSAQFVIPFSLSYGSPLRLSNVDLGFDNYLGFGIKLLWGVGHGEVVDFEGGLTTFKDRIVGVGTGKYRYSYDGFGLAFDIGWAAKFNDKMTVNLSLQNLFGYINWSDKNTEISEFNFDADLEVSDDFEEIEELFSESDTTYAGKGYQSDYPTYLVLGFQYDVIPNIELLFNYRQYFNEEYQFSTSPRISVGSQLYAAKWFPVRAGLSFGGFEKFQVGLGFGFHGKHYQIDFGISQTGGFFNSARGIGFAIGQKLLF